MANFVSNSLINLSINARQANMVLDSMKKKAEDLRKRMDEAAKAGDAKTAKRLAGELRQVERIINMSTTEAMKLEKTMRHLDQASPREINKALKTLQNQLSGIQRGSAAWDAQVAKIRQVKDAMRDLNEEINGQQSRWQRFNRWLNDTQTFLMGAAGAVTGLVMAGKSAVQKYADIEQEMANVRKFTGMTAEEVQALNGEFLKIDTRTAREDLNRLAQEAGRLGKTSQEDVLGFVRAADKINVALDDLGDGATLKLSKLTGIFGDEERYGTEQSLIKVGSVINELSQNCSASAPYIADFTERLGGVGAQAGMTIQQIMGYAAVLDSNAQKVEASATALSQVIVRLYQDPAKYARVAGLDVKNFTDLMRKDANSAVILFLETLNKAGGMDTLSPMFKDMGETGARAIAALSTLATNIQAVKDQQQVANEAFREGTSIQKEFDVQNNTVQASMDKAKKSITEIAVDLGERLMPVVRHIMSSSTAMVKFLSTTVKFIADNITAVISLTAAIAAYKIAVIAAASQTKAMTLAQSAWTVVAKANTVATTALSSAMYLLTGRVTKARAAWRLMSATIGASPFGMVAAAAAALAVVIYKLTRKTEEYRDAANKILRTTREVSQETVREQHELDVLFGKLRGARKGSQEYLDTKKKILDQYGKYLSGLVDEKGEIVNLSLAYDTLTEAVRRSARERGLAAAKENLNTAFAEQTSKDLTSLQKALESYGASAQEAARLTQMVGQAVSTGGKIPQSAVAKISALSSGLPSADAEGKAYTNYGQKVAAKSGLAFKAPEDPSEILSRLSNSIGDFDRSLKIIEDMQSESNKTRKYTGDDLRKTISDLDKVIKDGEGSVRFPNPYVARELRGDYDFSKEAAGESPVIPMGKAASGLLPSGNASSMASLMPGRKASGVPYAISDFADVRIDADTAKRMREVIAKELRLRGEDLYESESNQQKQEPGNYQKYVDPDKAKREEDKKFREALKKIEKEREDAVEKATSENAAGNTDYLTFIKQKHDAQMKFYGDSAKLYEDWKRTEEEGYSEMLRKRAEEERAWKARTQAQSIEEVKRLQKAEETELRLHYANKANLSFAEETELQARMFDIKLKAMQRELELTNKGSKEYADKKLAIEQTLAENTISVRQRLAQEAARIEAQYASKSAAEKLKVELETLKVLKESGAISRDQYSDLSAKAKKRALPDNKRKSPQQEARKSFDDNKKQLDEMLEMGLISQKEYSERLKAFQADLTNTLLSGIAQSGSEWVGQLTTMYQAWADFAQALKDPDGNPFDALAKGLQASAAVMGAVMQSVTALTNAEVEIQTQAIEKRYQRESAFAEGNAYLQKKLEKRKEKEIAKLKSDAAKKNFAMQVAATVASTAANAVSAYGAALQVGGLAGLILAPVAAAMALAQGAIQIAVLKKQQQAADSTGYAAGGFTRKGRRDEPAGIVHAGEWVASQALVNNPKTRPVIDMLEYAQRNNTVAQLSMEDVSRSVAAPMALAWAPQPAREVIVQKEQPSSANTGSYRLEDAIDRLNDRLDRPFITYNTVEGPLGIKQAEDEYKRLMKNKSR